MSERTSERLPVRQRILRVGVVVALLTLLAGVAQAISYTVQVVALSDQRAALALQRELLLDGFPAYVVRATTAQGDLFRVRVGVFGNRGAALVYAEAMPEIGGGRPQPALAEAIPEGIIPLEPRLLAAASLTAEVEVIPWQDGLALRSQESAEREALYQFIGDLAPVAFRAWRAVPADDGTIIRVRSLPLWPDSWEDDPDDVRSAYRASLLALVSSSSGVDRGLLEQAVLEPEAGPPYLVVAERFDPATGDGVVTAVAQAATPPRATGPEELVGIGADEGVPVLEPIFRVAPGEALEPLEELSSSSWRVVADGPFLRLEAADAAGRAWRAAVGQPLWAQGSYLLTRNGNELLLYEFLGP